MDKLLQWYNRLPARNLIVAGVAAIGVFAAFQAFASGGEYKAGPGTDETSPTVWSVPGRYFLSCKSTTGGDDCLFPKNANTDVYAKSNYTVTYRTINLPAGAYAMKINYANVGKSVPTNYSYAVKIKVNGQPISAGEDGTVLLPTTGKQPWKADFPVTLPAGETTISMEWTNDNTSDPAHETNFSVSNVSLTSKQATEAVAKRDDQRRNDLNQYRSSLSKYVVANSKYPEQNTALGMTPSSEPFAALKGKFMTTFLTDPTKNQAYYYISNGSRYGICADLESEQGTRYEVGPSGSRQTKGSAKECALLN
ncbi:hypothetical protein EXS54_01560 [Patescibacteria group bacterium]|nr:hypothetical protein [Patescibacteria group bacterium]